MVFIILTSRVTDIHPCSNKPKNVIFLSRILCSLPLPVTVDKESNILESSRFTLLKHVNTSFITENPIFSVHFYPCYSQAIIIIIYSKTLKNIIIINGALVCLRRILFLFPVSYREIFIRNLP